MLYKGTTQSDITNASKDVNVCINGKGHYK